MSAHTTCPGCARLQEHRDTNLDKVGDKVLPGQHVYLEPRDAFLARMAAKRQPPPFDD